MAAMTVVKNQLREVFVLGQYDRVVVKGRLKDRNVGRPKQGRRDCEPGDTQGSNDGPGRVFIGDDLNVHLGSPLLFA